jgi:hypothetical protein
MDNNYYEGTASIMWQSAEHWLVDNFQPLANWAPEEKPADLEAAMGEIRKRVCRLQIMAITCPACQVWQVGKLQPCRGCPVADESGRIHCAKTPWTMVSAIRYQITHGKMFSLNMWGYGEMCDAYHRLLEKVEEEYQYLVERALEETEKAWKK